MINETTEGQEAGDQREELFFKVIKAGNKILEILAALFIILMLLYGAYSLWDTCQINRRAFISGELMKYKPAGKTDESPSLQELQKINPDVCAWLTVDGTKIDYPVVQGETNLEYINQDIYESLLFQEVFFWIAEMTENLLTVTVYYMVTIWIMAQCLGR